MALHRASVLTLGALLASSAGNLAAAETDPERAAATAFSHEMIDCAVYYTMLAGSLEESGDEATATRYHDASIELFNRAILFIPRDAIVERATQGMEALRSAIDEGITDIAALAGRYGVRCKAIVEAPEGRIRELIAREKAKRDRP